MNISSFNQTLNTNFDSTLGEFSRWRVTMAIILISRLLFSVPITLLINTSILVTILKTKSLRRSLNLIHLSLLTVNCLILIPDVILTSTFIPTVLRYCECLNILSSVYVLVEFLLRAFHPLNFACLGVFQLLIIKGRKRFVSYKSVTASIAICSIITVFVISEAITVINLSGAPHLSRDVCPLEVTQNFWGSTVAFALYSAFCYFPSLFVVVLCTTWSCIVFKKSYTGGDDQLNRQIISLPIVLPLTLVIPSALSTLILGAIEQSLKSYVLNDY